LDRHGITSELINKVAEGYRPNVIDLMKRGEIALVLNTPEDGRAREDSYLIRRTAITQNIPYYLTVDGIQAAIGAIEALLKGEPAVTSLQEHHRDLHRERCPMTAADRVLVALDVETLEEAGTLLDRLRGVVTGCKIGSQLFTAAGPAAVELARKRDFRVFLDLKFHDIPNTVG